MADDEDVQVEEEIAAEQPEWLDPKFAAADNPVEAQARSYAEAQRLIQERGREAGDAERRAADAEQRLAELEAAQQQQYVGNGEQNPLVTAYERAFEEGDIHGMLAIQAQIAQAVAAEAAPKPAGPDTALLVQFAENQIRATNSDYDQYRDATVDVLKEMEAAGVSLTGEGATLQSVQSGIASALDMARGRAAYQQQQSEATKQAAADRARAEKQQAQTLPGGGTRPPTPDENASAWEKIVNSKSGGKLVLPGT